MASLTLDGSTANTAPAASGVNTAFGQALSGIGSTGNVQAYFQPQAPNFLQQPTVNNSNVAQALMGKGPLTNAPTLTSTGGTSFNPAHAPAYSTPAVQPPVQPTTKPDLNSFILGSVQSPNGGTISTAGNNPTGYNSGGQYSIDTNGVNSDSFSSGTSASDVMNKQKTLQDYVNGLAQANGYDPQYLQAYQQTQQAQTQGAQLGLNAAQYGLNSANINNQFYNGGPNIPGGATVDYLSGITAKAQAQNTLGQAGNTLAQGENQIQQLSANQALNTAQLARTGNIAAAQAQLQYSPGSITQQNAISQYNALQQQYPGANLPPIDPNQDLFGQLQNAHQIIAQSPAYQAGFQSTYQTPGGGTGIYNKLNANGLQQNPDGTLQLVSGAAAALGLAQSSALNQNISTYNQLAPAYKAANDDFNAMNNFMTQSGVNKSGVPIINQIQNSINSKVLDPGAMAAFKTYITSLRTNYANLLGTRGETPTQAGQDAIGLIPDNLDVTQMQKVHDALNTNGGNILNATQSTIQSLLGGLSSGQTTTQGQQSSGSGWGSLGD